MASREVSVPCRTCCFESGQQRSRPQLFFGLLCPSNIRFSADFHQGNVPQATQFPRVPPTSVRNDEPHADGRAILKSEAPRLETGYHSSVLLDLQRRRAFGDVNFVPVLVSNAIFVTGGAVSSASMILSWQQLHAALHRHALALAATAAAASPSPVPCQDNHARPAQGNTRQQASRAEQCRLRHGGMRAARGVRGVFKARLTDWCSVFLLKLVLTLRPALKMSALRAPFKKPAKLGRLWRVELDRTHRANLCTARNVLSIKKKKPIRIDWDGGTWRFQVGDGTAQRAGIFSFLLFANPTSGRF